MVDRDGTLRAADSVKQIKGNERREEFYGNKLDLKNCKIDV